MKARLTSLFSSVPPDGFPGDRVRLSWKLGGKHLIHLIRRRVKRNDENTEEESG